MSLLEQFNGGQIEIQRRRESSFNQGEIKNISLKNNWVRIKFVLKEVDKDYCVVNLANLEVPFLGNNINNVGGEKFYFVSPVTGEVVVLSA